MHLSCTPPAPSWPSPGRLPCSARSNPAALRSREEKNTGMRILLSTCSAARAMEAPALPRPPHRSTPGHPNTLEPGKRPRLRCSLFDSLGDPVSLPVGRRFGLVRRLAACARAVGGLRSQAPSPFGRHSPRRQLRPANPTELLRSCRSEEQGTRWKGGPANVWNLNLGGRRVFVPLCSRWLCCCGPPLLPAVLPPPVSP